MTSEQKVGIEDSFGELQERLKGSQDSFGRLMREVVNSGVCTHCGACVATCEFIDWDEVTEKPKLIGKCTGCGVCYSQCPRTIIAPRDLVGRFLSAYTGKSKIPEIKGQDGGVVTALLLYALEKKLIDCAVVTGTSFQDPWKPEVRIVSTREELLETSGSIYSHSQTLIGLIDAIKRGDRSIAFVGTPCNIDAVYKMWKAPFGLVRMFMRANILAIGLFCMDSFSYEGLKSFLESKKIKMNDIEKMTIKKGKMQFIQKNGNVLEARVHDLDRYRSSSCQFCTDLTSENADISVGSVGSADGYSTVLARTGIGQEILLDASDAGYIELTSMSRDKMKWVLNLARMKKAQLYTVRTRRRYVLGYEESASSIPPSGELVEAKGEIKDTGVIIKDAASRTKMLKLSGPELATEDQKEIEFKLMNNSGMSLENITIKVSHITEFFEDHKWFTNISVWYPFEELEFSYPRVKESEENEYLCEVKDHLGTIFTKKIEIKKLLAKIEKEKEVK
ncbi:MAG TPA: Coenzyme F420 hydrogenase/dehydrogenase, beta subunit C-terminal domain [Candidatus Deferrimicrobium sp.]|nr:Coenzyme F420 hydrogenase/dehydrogenase, beta subunit C-terminal domain [Candidatus Deferrimicrobium sp.]